MNDRTIDDRTIDDPTGASRSVDLTSSELALVRAALRLLESTLGHEEADELDEVQALLERLPNPERR